MKNILLPTDFSENSWNAIAYGLQFLQEYDCNFYLLNVNRISNLIDEETQYTPRLTVIEDVYVKPAKKELHRVLNRIKTTLPINDKHHFYTLTDHNFFIESIRNHVADKKIDMIVMGTKGASGLKTHITGSNTGAVITKVKCKTLVIPENATYQAIHEIAFPTDFILSYNMQTLAPILDILDRTNSSLRIPYFAKRNEQLNTNQQANKELLEDFFDNYKHTYHFLTNTKVEEAIQNFTEKSNIDLMVMVAKNLNYFQQILFHTKVEKISYHTDIPFLVLHE
ncbi:universal stress protein [uncultured Kordia sp.]|uniref:universal stress protein n=1 Tax=uncultured Kordia sp. TaxID=507699 RepID=UPI002620D6EF|nr:universal stress protein [uncultured Kordia sp.]